MKIFRNNVFVEMSLNEFVELLEDEEALYDISDLFDSLEEDEEEFNNMNHSQSGVAVLTAPTPDFKKEPSIKNEGIYINNLNIYNSSQNETELVSSDDLYYLDELESLADDEMQKVKRIIDRFSTLLE